MLPIYNENFISIYLLIIKLRKLLKAHRQTAKSNINFLEIYKIQFCVHSTATNLSSRDIKVVKSYFNIKIFFHTLT